MVLGRSQMNVAPILGLLMMLFVGFSWLVPAVPVDVTRRSEHGHFETPVPEDFPPRIKLHADGTSEVAIPYREHRRMGHAELLYELRNWREAYSASDPTVAIAADEGVAWGQFVETVSSVSHITGGQVAVVSDED
jgi:biopolymer transport protein ExbD